MYPTQSTWVAPLLLLTLAYVESKPCIRHAVLTGLVDYQKRKIICIRENAKMQYLIILVICITDDYR